MTIRDVAALVDGEIVGDSDRQIHSVRKIEEASEGDISFIANVKYARFHEVTRATSLLVGPDFHATRSDITYIRTSDPYAAFLTVLRQFAPPAETLPVGVHPTAVVADDAVIGTDVAIGAHVVIGSDSHIGSGSMIYPNTVIGREVTIGDCSIIHPNVTIYRGSRLGRDCIVHAGTVIGADGFGFEQKPDGTWEKVPQIGIVVIGQRVEIGANVTIDRATLGETRIADGVKLDNLIHVAHNVSIGANTVIAAQAGISGSTRIGESNMIAGQVGVVGHIETAANVIIEAQSGVSKSIRKSGRYFGHPVKEHAQALRQEGALRQLPDMVRELREIRNRLSQLESGVTVTDDD